ncbi:MAG TPA: DUF4145 domain-containing protein [Rhodanobacteraceae bacterium]|nr:DUF4145 domain-containing protein [Rhodanobacteraceae bacterium]
MQLSQKLDIDRCPHCQVALPDMRILGQHQTANHSGAMQRKWAVYCCSSCGGLVTAWSVAFGAPVVDYFPKNTTVDESVPERPRTYLQQAIESLHAPAGAIMLAASAIDAMLKLKGYERGSLYERIEAAANDHLITQEMARWAHAARLDANGQRHADEAGALPTQEEAKVTIDFVNAIAQFLFVLPAQIDKGIKETKQKGG